MPAFMNICGIVSFFRSFSVTRGIFDFLRVLDVVVLFAVLLEDVLEVVGNAEEEALVVVVVVVVGAGDGDGEEVVAN